MKNDVLKFLADGEQKPQEKFNKAQELYRRSKNRDESQVRFMNAMGFSPGRLEDLVYQLKKLHGITDLELATERNNIKAEAQKEQEKLEDEKVKTSVKLLTEALGEIDAEKMDLKDLKETESILAEEFDRIPADKIPDELSEIRDSFYEVLNKRHFANEFNILREKKENMNDEDFLQEVKKLPEDRMPEDFVEILANMRKGQHPEDDDKVKQLQVNAPEEVNADDQDKTSEASKDDQKKTSEENSKDDQNSEKEASKEIESTTDGDSDPDELKKAAEAEKAEFLKKDLGGFDVDSESYNSAKSFAAVLSDYINEDPKNQKWDTLKAFIQEAKKKHSKA